MPWSGQLKTEIPSEKPVRYLQKYSGPITGFWIGSDCAPMGKILEDGQTMFQNPMCPLAVNIGNKADSTGVVLVGRIIETELCG